VQHDVTVVRENQQFFSRTQCPSIALPRIQPVMIDGRSHQHRAQAMLTATIRGQNVSLHPAAAQKMKCRCCNPRTVTVSHHRHGNAGREIGNQSGQVQTVEAGHPPEDSGVDLRQHDRPFFTGPAVEDNGRRIVRKRVTNPAGDEAVLLQKISLIDKTAMHRDQQRPART